MDHVPSVSSHTIRDSEFVCLPLTTPSMKATCIPDGPPVVDQTQGASKLKEAEHDLPRQWSASPAELVIGTANPSTEVTQQSKARHKEDFLNAFSPFVADATSVAYKGAPADVQGKLRRVVDVWRERGIFDKEVMQDLYNRLSGECSNIFCALSPWTNMAMQKSTRRGPQPMSAALVAMHSVVRQGLRSLPSLPPWLRRSRRSGRRSSP